ncbi:DUF4160 domain-containing protein [Desulfosporosinus sp. PR]|uniref:DUF4160 domain-containing protein n=1 Tax=Candidatus Desulfosporosinus nitrosoreducens TaxID=3401928 RepID=UPI0027EB394E|nr:DUF4160 domain-containing protein [Desulfosporosinus sp. PR]MDQ7093937.1 DUF4160 domain-containing protein [Desulfosporosinus sp. PR]
MAVLTLKEEIILPPHFHATYGEFVGVFSIKTLEMLEGDLPNRAKSLVMEWAKLYQYDLMQMWETQEFRKLSTLE